MRKGPMVHETAPSGHIHIYIFCSKILMSVFIGIYRNASANFVNSENITG